MNVRRMCDADAEYAAIIEQEVFSCPWSRQGFLDSLANPNTIFLAAEEEVVNSVGICANVIVGYIGMYVSLDEGEITNVAVHPFFRRKGIGQALITAIHEEAQKAGVIRIVLEVRTSNEPAICLYKKAGFHEVGIRKGFYEKPKEDASIMVWEK